jgi:hypothetical protein
MYLVWIVILVVFGEHGGRSAPMLSSELRPTDCEAGSFRPPSPLPRPFDSALGSLENHRLGDEGGGDDNEIWMLDIAEPDIDPDDWLSWALDCSTGYIGRFPLPGPTSTGNIGRFPLPGPTSHAPLHLRC